MRNVVTRVVMVGFDPFNNSGLPEHIERQLVDDYFFWYNDYAMRQEFQWLELQLDEARKTTPVDPMLKDLFDRGLISQGELDQVTLLRGRFGDIDSNIFGSPKSGYIPFSLPDTIEDGPYIFSERDFNRLQAEGYITADGNVDLTKAFRVPVGDLDVVPPDSEVPMFGGVPMVQSGIDYTKHHSGKHRFFAPGSLDRLRHYEEGALDRTIKKSSMSPEQQAALDAALPALTPVFKDGEFLPAVTGAFAVGADGVKRDLRDIDFMSILLGTSEPTPIEGEVIAPPSVELDDTPNRRDYGIPIHQYLDGDGNVQYQVGELNEKPLEGQIVDKGVEVRVIPDDYEFPPHVSQHGDGYKLDHIAKLPPATGAKPLIQQFHEITKQTSQGRGRDETMAIYHEYHLGLEALEEQIAESRSAGPSLLPKPDLTAGEVGDASAELAKIRERQSMQPGYNKHEDERGHNEALGLFTRTRPNPLREHWEKHGDPYEGRLPPYTNAEVLKEILDQNHDPELAAKVKQRMMEGLGDLEDTSDAGLPPVNPTPEEIADQEAAMQEAAEGKLDYLLEGTQWDPKLRK
ncbi:hypothetical protein D3C78_670180 [compost metagenome]